MNFKRTKSKRNVRCTICTPDRWMGNNKSRFKEKFEADRTEADKEIKEYLDKEEHETSGHR